MSISTTITRPAGIYSNTTPVIFNIDFGSTVDNTFVLSDITVTNGTAIKLNGTGASYTVEVNPTVQGDTVSVQVLDGVAFGTGPELNAASNIFSVTYNSIKPIPVITHEIRAVTNNQFLKSLITFVGHDMSSRTVIGLIASDIEVSNCVVTSLTGSGSVYNLTVTPLNTGEVSFYVKADAAIDAYTNTCVKSNEVRVFFDNTSFDDKRDAVDNSVTSPDVLIDFKLEDLRQVAEIQAITDCARTIPQRLLMMAEAKAFEMIASNPTVQKLVGAIAIVESSIQAISEIIEEVQAVIKHPETLLEALLVASGLTGEALRAKMQAIADEFSSVTGLDAIIASVMESGICGATNYSSNGQALPKQTLTPTDTKPPSVPGVGSPVTSTYDSRPKDRYDDFLFQLKESLEVGSVEEQSPDRARMLSVITTLAMGYHDEIVATIDSSRDVELFEKYRANVESEKNRNLGWDDKIKSQFESRTNNIGDIINRNTNVIRAFMNKNKQITGEVVSVGVTTYSGPDKDFTTFLDIKPEQRPSELTSYWSSKYNIPSQESKLNARGIKTGTLNYSDAYSGAYGQLIPDQTVASSRFPGGSVIALRNSDGTPYNPSGKNPSGQFRVTDTGNAKLTYSKPDIFTSTPELYVNTGSVQVVLISEGAQKGKQYMLAQQRYGDGSNA